MAVTFDAGPPEEVTVDVVADQQATVDVITQPAGAVEVILDATSIPGPVGPTGPPGVTGLVKVTHNADPNLPRPDAPLVYWVGTVQPIHADPDDLLLMKEP